MKTLKNIFLLGAALLLATVAEAQVVTQLAKESTKIPKQEKNDRNSATDSPSAVPVEVNLDTTSTYFVMIDSAQTAIGNKQWNVAEKYLLRAIAEEPGNPSNSLLLSNLATLQRYQGRFDDAIKNYTMALDLTPNAVTLLLNRAAVYVTVGNTPAAIADYNRVRELDGTDAESRYSLGMLAVETHDFSQAEDLFNEIKRVNPTSALSEEGLGILAKAQGNYPAAIKHLSEVIKSRPDPRLLANRADCYLVRKELNKAEEDIRNALDMDPDDGYLYVLRAKLNKLRFAREDVERDINLAVEHGVDRKVVNSLLQQE